MQALGHHGIDGDHLGGHVGPAEFVAELRQLAGQYESGLQLATELTESADELEFLPLRAEAWLRRGALEEKSGDYANAEFSLRRALWAAEAGRHDEVAVDGLTLLLGVVGDRLARHEDTKALTERLTAALARLGDDNLRKAQAYNTIGRVYASQGEYEEAVKLQLKAVRLGEQLFDGGNHPVVATFLLDLGQAHESQPVARSRRRQSRCGGPPPRPAPRVAGFVSAVLEPVT